MVDYPPFTEFAMFIQELSLERNDPNLVIDTPERDPSLRNRQREVINAKKTEVDADDTGKTSDPSTPRDPSTPPDPSNWCIIHQKSSKKM